MRCVRLGLGFVIVALASFAPSTLAQDLTVEWSWTVAEPGDPYPGDLNVTSTPVVMDVNGDGTADVIISATASTAGGGVIPGVVRALDGDDGRQLFVSTTLVNATCTLAAGDIDGDARPEMVTVNDSGTKLVVLEHDGTFKWTTPTWSLFETCQAGAPSLADLDGDGTPEIVIGRQAVRADGTLLWTGTGGSGSAGFGPLSIVVDVTGDGTPEVLAGDTAYRANGTVLWNNVPAPDGFTAAADFDGDLHPEVVLIGGGNVWLLEGLTGQTRWGPVAIPGGGNGGPPAVADVDGDGTPEIAASAAARVVVFESDGSLKWQVVISDNASARTGTSAFDFDADGAAEIVHRDETSLRVLRGETGDVLHQAALSSCTWTEYPAIADVDGDAAAEIVVAANRNCGYGSDSGVYVFGSSLPWAPARWLWNQHSYHATNVSEDGTIPSAETPHWTVLNGFRQNSQAPPQVADLTVTQSDAPDPQFEGLQIDYHVLVTNSGPSAASVMLTDTIPSGSTYLGVTTSQGSCAHDAGAITCSLGELAEGNHADVIVSVAAPPGWGTSTNVATVTIVPPAVDPDLSDNTSSESTQVRALNIGDFVWKDLDGDGIQDAGEPGVPGVVVLLYDGVGGLLASQATNHNGYYNFAYVDYGVIYNLAFILPAGYVFAPRDQGTDDGADSDADPATGATATFALTDFQDAVRWDAGLVPDADRDGYTASGGDCNDADPAVHPGAAELCNGWDDDCDGPVDETCDAICDLPSEVGNEVDLTPTATNVGAPRIMWNGTEYGVASSDTRDGNSEIYFTRFDASFNRIGTDVRVTDAAGSSLSPYLAWTGTEYGVAWQDDRDGGGFEIYFARLDRQGNKIGGDLRVTNAVGISQRPRLVWSGTSYGLLWNDSRDGTLQNYFAELDAAGNPIGTDRRITPLGYSVQSGRVDWSGSVYGVVYSALRGGVWDVWFQTLDRHGNPVTPETSVTNTTAVIRTPVIAWDGVSQFGIGWLDNRSGGDQLFFTRVAADGTKLTGDHPLVALASSASIPQMIVHSGAEWALTWIDQAIGNAEIYFGRVAGDALNGPPIRVTDDPATAQNPALAWNGTEYAIAFAENRAGASAYHAYGARIGCCTVSTIGDRVWSDADSDGIQDSGEGGVRGALVAAYDPAGAMIDAVSTAADGSYRLDGLSCGSTYELRFFPPGSDYLSPRDQGADDTLDSDADPVTGSTGFFVLTSSADASKWDAGIAACWPPDEPVYIYRMTVTSDGNAYPVIHFQDPNQAEQVTGYNVRRSSTAAPPPEEWPLVATDVIDMDEAEPNRQWVDQSGDVSPTGVWFYQVTGYNHMCPAEGPF
jgi:uncharacterized repeat protein (TIGR01451 family)